MSEQSKKVNIPRDADGKQSADEKVDESEYGKFGWATDPEGNRFELWEPPGMRGP